jgi:cytochrome bd ubiquinol oxidase subunit II
MSTAWFVLLAFMLTVYVVLDGFDLGAGILHPLVTRSDEDSRTVLAAIGPVWDGNEVWLIAAGGLLVFAFPAVYAAAFSGFYLPLMLVLWSLVLRGIAIEMRSQHENVLWRQFFDVMFAAASTMLALVLGVALGNVLRGVPLDASESFLAPLWASFHTTGDIGAIDWYTLSVGVFAVAMLAGHAAMYLRWKTEGELQARVTRLVRPIWIAIIALGVLVTIETAIVQPALFAHLAARPGLWILPVLGIAAIVVVFVSLAPGRELRGFIASALVIASLLALTAGALYPLLLPSTIDPAYSLDVPRSANDHTSLALGLAWWIPAIVLAIGYFTYLFRSFRGKARPDDYHV